MRFSDEDEAVAVTDAAREMGLDYAVVTSVTRPFCGGCNRLRLSAEGRLYTCLFAADGEDLRGRLRNGADDDASDRLGHIADPLQRFGYCQCQR